MACEKQDKVLDGVAFDFADHPSRVLLITVTAAAAAAAAAAVQALAVFFVCHGRQAEHVAI
jgi:hypothetical protein